MYPVGIDPIWHRTTNKITFFNSYKMKISIVVGVLQMTVGIILSLLNHLEYRDYKKVFFQFVPEFVFFQGIFGYLVFTILYKWSVDWTSDDVPHVVGHGPEPAPSLLTLLINMFMAPTTDITVPLYGHVCFTDCETAQAGGYCSIASVLEACPDSCALGDFADTAGHACQRHLRHGDQALRQPGAAVDPILPVGRRLHRGALLALSDPIHRALPAQAVRKAQGPVQAVRRQPGRRRRRRGRLLLWRRLHPPGHPHDRVRAWLDLQHGLVPAAMGALARALAARRALQGHDPRRRRR